MLYNPNLEALSSLNFGYRSQIVCELHAHALYGLHNFWHNDLLINVRVYQRG